MTWSQKDMETLTGYVTDKTAAAFQVEITRLEAINADLLEALEDAVAQVEATVPLDWKEMNLSYPNVKAWRAAIARARKG